MKQIKVGITGGIGSGKSIVCRILQILGYPVFDADREAREVYLEANIRKEVTELLGPDSYLETGEPNRKWIADLVFRDAELLKKLNNIIHPAVRHRFLNWAHDNSTFSIIFKEAAIMFESGSHLDLDFTVGVTAPENLRIERVMARDGKSEELVRTIISKQLSQSELASRCDVIIINDEHTPVIQQVLEMIDTIKIKSGLS